MPSTRLTPRFTDFSPTRAALSVERLSVAFDRTPVLSDLTFTVAAGSTLAVIGPNGAGKSALLRALINAIPSTGTIRWAPATTLGYVPQKLDLERDLSLTGFDLLRAKANICHTPATAVTDALRLVELPDATARHTIGRMSGGEFQRLLLAFALMGQPTTLLFDEPTAGLDAPGVRAVYSLLERLQRDRGLTLIVVSHDLSVVYERADRVLCLSRSRTFFGPPTEVLTPEHLEQLYGGPVRFHGHDDAAA